jgi:serine/threonine protein phosphatase PrpC
MLIQQIHPPFTFHRARVPTLSGAGGVITSQPDLALQVGSELDPGIRRREEPNEDSISVVRGVIPALSSKAFVLLMVADGMGGQQDGQEASRLAVQSLSTYVEDALHSPRVTPAMFLSLLKAGIQYGNQALYQRNREQDNNMGTTMTATLVVGDTAYVAHVGDSRCYLYREPAGLSQITQDHSLVAALAAAGIIRPEDIYTHPRRNLIYRCLGDKKEVEVDTYTVALAAGDILLLCSDGLWEMVRDPQIAAILASPTGGAAHTAHALVQAALAGGGDDNISALVAQVCKV